MSSYRTIWRPWVLALGGVFAVALALRLLGLAFGLPAVYNQDETPILNRALAFAKGDPNPHNFLYPSLYFYMVFAWETLFFLVGRLVGTFASMAEFQREYFTDPSRLVLAARALTALCGALTVLALYWFGSRLYGRAAGLAAALFYAVSPIAARDAHYVKHDVPVTLLIVLAHAALARIVVDPEVARERRAWFIAGLLAGLAVSTHYYSAPIVFSLAVVALATLRTSRRWQTSLGLLSCAALAVVIGFFVGTPFILAEPATALRDMTANRAIVVDRAVAGGRFASLGVYLEALTWDAVGWPVAIAAVAGTVWALIADWRRALLLVTFPLLFLAFIANTVPATRYLNPALPFVTLAAAFALTRVASRVGRPAALATTALVIAAAVPGIAATIRTDEFIRQTDTRTSAQQYIETHLPSGASILIQPYSVPLRQSRDGLVEALRTNLGAVERASIKFQLQLASRDDTSPSYRTIYLGDGGMDPDKIYVSPRTIRNDGNLAALESAGVKYVVLKRFNPEDPAILALAAILEPRAELMARFSPYRPDVSPEARAAVSPFLHNSALRIDPALERPGPIVEIWRITSWN